VDMDNAVGFKVEGGFMQLDREWTAGRCGLVCALKAWLGPLEEGIDAGTLCTVAVLVEGYEWEMEERWMLWLELEFHIFAVGPLLVCGVGHRGSRSLDEGVHV